MGGFIATLMWKRECMGIGMWISGRSGCRHGSALETASLTAI
jgi:hypothetical protein